MAPYKGLPAAVIAMATVFVVFAWAAIALRILATHIRERRYKIHDYLSFTCATCVLGYAVSWYVGVAYGDFGRHFTELPLTKIPTALKIFFATEFFWATGVGAFRVSILFLYIELFPNRKFFWSAVATQALVIAYWIACILTICLLCRPINFNWNKTIQGTCGNVKATELASAGFNMFVDILVVCLPLPMVWRLQMPLNKKIGVTSTFAFGLCIAGINLARLIQTLVCDPADFTYCAAQSAIIAIAENSCGAVVACIPTLGPVVFPKRFGPSAQRYHGGPPTDWGHGSSGKTPIRSKDSDKFDEGSFHRLDEEDIELVDHTPGINHKTTASRGPAGPFVGDAQIGVRKDLHVYTSPHGYETEK